VILVDASVWVRHFREGDVHLRGLLLAERVMTHPFVTGEIACGPLRRRRETMELLANLPQAVAAEHGEVLVLLRRAKLFGKGIGWVDVHLLCSALLSSGRLWTMNRRLGDAASRLRVAHRPG
jgi:predicted nucleic acid-binding protein